MAAKRIKYFSIEIIKNAFLIKNSLLCLVQRRHQDCTSCGLSLINKGSLKYRSKVCYK